MPADVPDLMVGIGTQLETISGLRVYAYPADSVSAPAAIVSWPEEVTYDETMARGSDRLNVPVLVLVGKVSDRSSAAQLGEYLSGTGSRSVKTAIEADKTLSGAAQTSRVTEARVDVIPMGGIEYVAAIFNVEVIA